jgi:competence protein ComEA
MIMERVVKKASARMCFFVVLAFMASVLVSQGIALAALVDINSASVKELESLPGVGSAIAKKIVANRPYKSVDELTKAGLSKKAIDKLRPLVTVGAAAPAAAPAAAAPKAAGPKTVPAAAKAKTAAEKPAATKLAPGQKVNINAATMDQLIALPGIGPSKAQAIIDGRPYKTPEDIMKVKGIKGGTYNKIKDFITVQ